MNSTDDIFEGPLSVDHGGAGYIATGSGTIRVSPEHLLDALHGDLVRVRARRVRGRLAGHVIAIGARPPRRLVGVVDGGRWFIADDARFGRALELRNGTAADDDLVCGVELLPWTSDRPEVRMGPVFGPRGRPRPEVESLLWREGIDLEFSHEALTEARGATAGSIHPGPDRLDLRGRAFVTIDPATAEDHDDAVFAERRPDGSILVLVAIADVAAFVATGGALDHEARRRGTFLYLPGRVIPMLPACISNDAASLMAGVDRAAVVLEMLLDERLRVVDQQLRRAVIRVAAALTYDDVAETLASNGRRGSDGARNHATMLGLLHRVAQELRTGRVSRGAFAVDLPSSRIECDRISGLPTRIVRVTPTRQEVVAHQLVEELMLLANTTVARRLHALGIESIFRSHDAPPSDQLAGVVANARRHGVELATPGMDARTVRDVIARVERPDVHRELSKSLMESMPPARYVEGANEHFALATERYVHFTSPIRRHADLSVHRALLGDAADDASMVARDLNESQRRARALQRQIDDLYGALLMEPRVGELLDGIVLRVGPWQIIVAADEPAVVVRCPRPARVPEVGHRVAVRIERVSISTREIEASILEND